MLRVLTLSTLFPDAARPGFGSFVARQTQALAALPDVEVTVVAPLGLPPWPMTLHPRYQALARLPHIEMMAGLVVHRPRFPIFPGLSAAINPALMARAALPLVRRLHRDRRFDVIDAEFFYPDGPAAIRIGRALGLPVSIKARGSDINLWSQRPACRRQITAAAETADGLLAVSAAQADALASLGVVRRRIRVHYTGVDLDRFRPRDRDKEKAALGLSGPLLIQVGTLNDNKGPHITMGALPQLPEATLALLGDGPSRIALEALARRLGVADRVRFLGRTPHDVTARWMAAADVLVAPSANEGLANVWVEALASGTPVVATRAGGAAEVIDRPAYGRLVERTEAAVAAGITDLLADPPDRAALRRGARRFSWTTNAEALRQHLLEMVRGGDATRMPIP